MPPLSPPGMPPGTPPGMPGFGAGSSGLQGVYMQPGMPPQPLHSMQPGFSRGAHNDAAWGRRGADAAGPLAGLVATVQDVFQQLSPQPAGGVDYRGRQPSVPGPPVVVAPPQMMASSSQWSPPAATAPPPQQDLELERTSNVPKTNSGYIA